MPLRTGALRPLVPIAALLSHHDWKTTMKHFSKMSGFRLSLGAFALGVDAYVMAGLLPSIGSTFAVSPSSAGQTVSIFNVLLRLGRGCVGLAGAAAAQTVVPATTTRRHGSRFAQFGALSGQRGRLAHYRAAG